jgi:hypothetical protein
MKLKHTLIAGLIGSLSLLSSATLLAATPDAGCRGDHAGGPPPPGGDPGAMAQQRLTKLKTDLKITADQDGAWQTFATLMAQRRAAHEAAHAARTAPSGTAPERLGQLIEGLKLQLADRVAEQGALQDLYSVLSTEQRTVADQHFSFREGPGRPGKPPRDH